MEMKSPGLKCPLTQKFMVEKARVEKFMVEKSGVEMSFNPYKKGQKILHEISIKMTIESIRISDRTFNI